MSTNSTKIDDRYCLNCGLAKHDCNRPPQDDCLGYCINWTPTEMPWDNIKDFQLEESESEMD